MGMKWYIIGVIAIFGFVFLTDTVENYENAQIKIAQFSCMHVNANH